jgi:predicted ATPase
MSIGVVLRCGQAEADLVEVDVGGLHASSQQPSVRDSMKRYVLTGAPGAGKTSILRILQRQGYAVVGEAATDVISSEQERGVAEPWQADGFIDKIVSVQRRREQELVPGGARVQIFDRSPLCTLALARYLQHPATPALAEHVARITREQLYERAVFFIRPIGFIEPTAARRISYSDSLVFERLHETAYRDHGFEIVNVPAGDVTSRAAAIADFITSRP